MIILKPPIEHVRSSCTVARQGLLTLKMALASLVLTGPKAAYSGGCFFDAGFALACPLKCPSCCDTHIANDSDLLDLWPVVAALGKFDNFDHFGAWHPAFLC